MQEYQKLLKKTNKSAVNSQSREITNQSNDIEGLLKIDLLTIPEKLRFVNQMQSNHSREATSRKSHKSLAANLQKLSKPPKKNKKKEKEKQKIESVKTGKAQTQQTTEKQSVDEMSLATQRFKQPLEHAKQPIEHEFVEKKMKVGQKVKNNAMKEFILSTLMKGKAEGTCLVIHKGTAQCSYSPISKNKSETSKYQKEEFPLILVQDHKQVAEKRKKHHPNFFGGKPNKVNRSSSTKSTAINLPSINKKWVKMAKQYEKKDNKLLPKENIEVIQQKIEACEDEEKENQLQQIQQQIIANNESIVNEKKIIS